MTTRKQILEALGHTILEAVQKDGQMVYLTQKNDVYSDGEVERWHIYTTKGHVANGCYEWQIRARFKRFIAA